MMEMMLVQMFMAVVMNVLQGMALGGGLVLGAKVASKWGAVRVPVSLPEDPQLPPVK